MSRSLDQLLDQWQRDASLRRSFARRCELAEQLDASLLGEADAGLQLIAAELFAQLEAADARFFARLRARLRHGRYSAAGLARGLARYAAREDDFDGYAPLDVLLAGLLDAGELPEEQAREAEMVSYQPAPGRVILALLEHVRAGDVFYDIGSGLGRVVIVVALLTGARAKGVENQAAFCEYATRVAQALCVRSAQFIAQDARTAQLDDGSVFFLYTPFRGAMLRAVLSKLRELAAHGGIRICSFGPCTPEIAQQPWLRLHSGSLDPEQLAVFESVGA